MSDDANDIRVLTTLPDHPKTKKLIRRLGPMAGWYLIRLFLWARDNRPNGDLAGMTAEDIELAVDWSGENDAFVHTLLDVRFLDGTEGAYRLHDWADHNPWSNGARHRSLKARWNAIKRHHGPAEADRQVPEWAAQRHANRELEDSDNDAASTESDASSNADSTDAALHPAESSNAPSPSPYPSPVKATTPPDGGVTDSGFALSPLAEGGEDGNPPRPAVPDCPHAEIVALYHELLPELRQVRSWDADRQAFLRARWRENPKRQNLAWWRKFFAYVRKCPWLMGQETDRDGKTFSCDLEWLIRPRNFRKVLEGKYQAKAQSEERSAHG